MKRRLLPSIALVLVATASLFTASLAAPAPRQEPAGSCLVELKRLDPTIRIDVRYATRNNFMHMQLYPQARAFLQKPAAEALVRAHRFLKKKGFGIVLLDGYRPWRITKLMWDRSSDAWRKGGYVADPARGSRHNRGCAADVTMFDLKSGKEVEMPTPYDDFTTKAHAHAPSASAKARAHRTLLQEAMLGQGFLALPEEWWHFDFQDWKRYPILDVDFDAVKAPPAAPAPASPLPGASPSPTAQPAP